MAGRTFVTGSLVALVVAVAATMSVSGQAGAPAFVITAYNGRAPIPYAVPKTPWGDPDLQGTWTSDDCIGTPMNRPANLGDRLYRNHLSFIKDFAPEIGRGVRLTYTLRFF